MASSNQPARNYVNNAYSNLVDLLKNLPLILKKLKQQSVFNSIEVRNIHAGSKKNKTRMTLDLVLNKGEEACYQFLRILDCERESVLPKPDPSSRTPDLHTWICLFSFREDNCIQGKNF